MKSFAIRINEPCHENWDAMTPNEQGKFCGACAKTVVDFTNYSTDDIIGFFKKDKGNTCGRFTNTQLQKTYVPTNVYRGYFIKPLAAVMLPLVMLASCNDSMNTTGKAVVADTIPKVSVATAANAVLDTVPHVLQQYSTVEQLYLEAPHEMEPIATLGYPIVEMRSEIMGDIAVVEPEPKEALHITIVDEQQQPIAHALVEDTVTKQQLFTDSLGNIPLHNFDTLGTARISHEHFATKYITLQHKNMQVVLLKDEAIVVTGYSTARKYDIMGAVAIVAQEHLHNKTNDSANTEIRKADKQLALQLYPNPITTAQLLSIQTLQLPEGNYMFELLDNKGAVLDKQFFLVSKQLLQYRLKNSFAAGLYYVVLTHKNLQHRFTGQLFIN
jgi:hypothetical protein